MAGANRKGLLACKVKECPKESPATNLKLKERVAALYSILGEIYGSERLVLRASKLGVLETMQSSDLPEQVLTLQKLVNGDPTLEKKPSTRQIPSVLKNIEDTLAQIVARRVVEDELEKKISQKIQERQDQYIKDMKAQVLKEKGGPENATTLKKLAVLEKMKQVSAQRFGGGGAAARQPGGDHRPGTGGPGVDGAVGSPIPATYTALWTAWGRQDIGGPHRPEERAGPGDQHLPS